MRNLVFLILLIYSIAAQAQWDCKSKLGSQLKPVGESDLLWASEITATGAYLSNSMISGAMGFVGLDYTKANHNLYVEGGLKYWNKYDLDLSYDYSNYRLGLREAFYRRNQNSGYLTLGLHSATLKDKYLLNERVLGASYEYAKGRFQINATAGTISTAFSRNGKFCNTCFLYDIIPNRPLPLIGNKLGETNMAALRFNLTPKVKKTETISSGEDEFSEFSDEFAESEEAKWISLTEYGALLYTEFEYVLENAFANAGAYVQVNTWGNFDLDAELLVQSNGNDLGLISTISLKKQVFWDNAHRSVFQLSYYGFNELTEGATPLNRFSNILAGQVLRLDAPELPIYLASYKHTIPSLKAHLKCQYALSTYTDSMQELDVQIGKTFFKQLQVSAIGAYVKSDIIPEYKNTYLAQVEMRYSF